MTASTTITCKLGGGRTGTYDVVVFVSGIGFSTPDSSSQLEYKIVVESLSMSSGSMGGGYELTIYGRNMG